MLEAIRKRAASFVIKVLFVVLVLSFVVWGIGDVVSPSREPDWAARVGDVTISTDAFNDEYRDVIARLSRSIGAPIDREEAAALGLPRSILSRQIDRALLDRAAADFGLAVSDELVREVIVGNPQFRGADGGFDGNLFRQMLQANAMSEPAFVALLRAQIGRDLVTEALRGGPTPPAYLVRQIERFGSERRSIAFIRVPTVSAKEAGEPSADQLRAFHAEHPEMFMRPERRTISAIVLRPKEIAERIVVADDELRAMFDARVEEWTEPERRSFEQLLFDSEDEAMSARGRVLAGASMATVAAEMLGQGASEINIADAERTGLPPGLADAVFALPKDALSEPVHTSLGWHLLRVTTISAATVPSFESVLPTLRAEVAEERAVDMILDLGARIEDDLAAGMPLEEVAAQLAVPLVAGQVIEAGGVVGDTDSAPDLPPDLIATAFSLVEGEESRLRETDGNVFYVTRVDRIEPATLPEIETIREPVRAAWQEAERRARTRTIADAMAEEVRGGQGLDVVARTRELPVTTPPPLARADAGDDPAVPLMLVNRLFETRRGEPSVVEAADAVYLGVVTAINHPDEDGDGEAMLALRQDIRERMGDDLHQQLLDALRRIHDVTINDRVLQQP